LGQLDRKDQRVLQEQLVLKVPQVQQVLKESKVSLVPQVQHRLFLVQRVQQVLKAFKGSLVPQVQLVQLVLRVLKVFREILVQQVLKAFKVQLVQQVLKEFREILGLREPRVQREPREPLVLMEPMEPRVQYHLPHLVLPLQEQLMAICGSTPHQEMYSYTSPMVWVTIG
jgi:hypothetical protein